MSDTPFSPTNGGVLVTAQAVTNAQASIGTGPAGRAARIVNLAATPVYAKAGSSTVDATNTDFTVLGSSTGILMLSTAATHVSVKASTGSNSSVLVQPGFVGR